MQIFITATALHVVIATGFHNMFQGALSIYVVYIYLYLMLNLLIFMLMQVLENFPIGGW